MSSDIESLISAAEAELRDLEVAVAPLLEKVQAKRKEIALLRAALSARQGAASQPSIDQSYHISDHIIAVLRAAGRPLTILEIFEELERRAVAIPGRGTTTNLVAYLRRTDGVERVRRGLYGLSEWSDR